MTPTSLHDMVKNYWQLGLLIAIVVGGFYQLKIDIVRIEGKFEGYAYLAERLTSIEERVAAHDLLLLGQGKDIQQCVENIKSQK